jgi:hypothetical protein
MSSVNLSPYWMIFLKRMKGNLLRKTLKSQIISFEILFVVLVMDFVYNLGFVSETNYVFEGK